MSPSPRITQPALPQPSNIIGYARVSTSSQTESLAEQRERLHQLGAARVFEDVASGVRATRPGLAAARDYLRAGDTLTVTRLDRLGRSMLDTLTTLHELVEAGVRVRALDLDLDTETPAGRMVVHVLAALAEWERDLLRQRTHEGLAHARARGRVGGRRRALSPADQDAVRAILADGTLTLTQIGQMFGVSARTISRVHAGTYDQPARD